MIAKEMMQRIPTKNLPRLECFSYGAKLDRPDLVFLSWRKLKMDLTGVFKIIWTIDQMDSGNFASLGRLLKSDAQHQGKSKRDSD